MIFSSLHEKVVNNDVDEKDEGVLSLLPGKCLPTDVPPDKILPVLSELSQHGQDEYLAFVASKDPALFKNIFLEIFPPSDQERLSTFIASCVNTGF